MGSRSSSTKAAMLHHHVSKVAQNGQTEQRLLSWLHVLTSSLDATKSHMLTLPFAAVFQSAVGYKNKKTVQCDDVINESESRI